MPASPFSNTQLRILVEMPIPEDADNLDIHARLNEALAAVQAMVSVLHFIAENGDAESAELAQQTLDSPTLANVLDPPV